jgi:hypothetical protein
MGEQQEYFGWCLFDLSFGSFWGEKAKNKVKGKMQYHNIHIVDTEFGAKSVRFVMLDCSTKKVLFDRGFNKLW